MTEVAARFVFDPARRRVGLRTGKVELGQHVHEAYEELVARGLGIGANHIRCLPASTSDSPNDGLTVGSLSIQITGQVLADTASSLAFRLKACAALRLELAPADVELDGDTLQFTGGAKSCDLFEIVATLDAQLIGSVCDTERSTELVKNAVNGTRIFIQDMTMPGLLHARALRSRAVAEVGPLLRHGCRILTDAGFSAVVAEDEASLLALWSRLPDDDIGYVSIFDGPVSDWIKVYRHTTTQRGSAALSGADLKVSASRPFLLHGSVAPACAIALWQHDSLTVWTHSQGIFPLREQIARVLNLKSDMVTVRHVPSAGCYGHNAADDAAMDAALVAMQVPDSPVRIAWPRQDEFRHAPVGAPMLVESTVALDAEGQISAWHQEIWSGPHGQRPGGGGHVNLLAALERDPALFPQEVVELPEAIGSGAARNAIPLYAIPAVTVTTHVVQDLPVRCSSIRGLGTQVNTVAIEAMMDKLASISGASPFEVRSRHLNDTRALAVLNKLEAACAEALLAVDGVDDEAIGIGIGRYKNKAAYAAVAARISLDEEPRLLELWAVVDPGQVASRDGVLNQIEGGLLQAASWTLREGVLLREGRIDAKGWEDYPTLGWDEIPTLHVQLIEHLEQVPPLGVGECMVGPTSAAIVNAVSGGLGETLAHLPLSRARLLEALAG